MRKHELQIANFVCTFGDSGELVDYIEEIVIPAFFTDTLIRRYGDTSYYIYEPKWIELASEGVERELAISGRFVKDTILKREQVLDEGVLVESHDAMQSSPSAFFVLIISDHRLLYFAETAFAPELNAFESTMESFLRKTWQAFVRKHQAALMEAEDNVSRITLKDVQAAHPRPVLNIVPVAKNDQIENLMRDFDRIEKIKFRLIRPNQETDASEVFQSVRERFEPLKPSRLDVEIADSDGLSKDESISAVQEAAAGLNTDVTVTGVDGDGNRLKANNQEFALKIPIEDPSENDQELATSLFGEFLKQFKNGNVKRFLPSEKVKEKIRDLRGLLL